MSDKIKHSEPISIPNSGSHSHSRTRSASFSASSSDDDSNSPPPQTPTSAVPPPRVATTSHSPSTSPILSYFFQAPSKVASIIPQSPSAGFGSIGRGFSAKPQEQPIIEEDEDHESPIVRHARRLSTSAGWVPAPAPRPNPTTTTDQTERGAGLLRRLSLGGAFVRPQPQPPSPPSSFDTPLAQAASIPSAMPPPPPAASPGRKKRRASTLGVPGEGSRPRRSPSPMSERILKGHFDGFN